MFRLPVCPHCHTVYHYGDVRKNKNEKVIQCYHCKKSFVQKRKGLSVLFAIVLLAAVIINILILSHAEELLSSIMPISIVSIIAVILAILFAPYFITYRKDKQKSNDKDGIAGFQRR